MKSRIVGQLRKTEFDDHSYRSDPIKIPYFDHQEIEIDFFEPEESEYLTKADKVLESFLRLGSMNRLKDSDQVFDYYSEILRYGYTDKLNLSTKEDIWKYVNPLEILLEEGEGDIFYAVVSCECAWEEEHGLQLVFTNGKLLTRASGHDGHYTDD